MTPTKLVPIVLAFTTMPALAQMYLPRENAPEQQQYEASLRFVPVDAAKAECVQVGGRITLKVNGENAYVSRIFWSETGRTNELLRCGRALSISRTNGTPLQLDAVHGEFRAVTPENKKMVIHSDKIEDFECGKAMNDYHVLLFQNQAVAYTDPRKCQNAVDTAKVTGNGLDFDLSTNTLYPAAKRVKEPAANAARAEAAEPVEDSNSVPAIVVPKPPRTETTPAPAQLNGTLD